MGRLGGPAAQPGGPLFEEAEVRKARARLLKGLERGRVHLHYARGSGRSGHVFVLTIANTNNPICGTFRCSPIPKDGGGLRGGLC